MLDELARFQMCAKVVVDFPAAWRKNVIESKRELRTLDFGGHAGRWEPHQLDLPVWIRAEQALREITRCCAATSVLGEECQAVMQSLAGDPVVNLILEACLKHQVRPDEILGELEPYESGF